MANAELDLESLSKKYTCSEDECGKIFFDQGKKFQTVPFSLCDIGSYRKH
jgi:hypothetical protein